MTKSCNIQRLEAASEESGSNLSSILALQPVQFRGILDLQQPLNDRHQKKTADLFSASR